MSFAGAMGVVPLPPPSMDDLLVDELLELFARELLVRVVEVEEGRVEGRALRLVVRVMVAREVGVPERLLAGDALLGVEGEAALEQVDGERRGVGKQADERLALLERERSEVVSRPV